MRTPVPNEKHTSCLVCNIHYKEGEYKKHIRSDKHAQSVKAQDHIYGDIDIIIGGLNTKLAE